MQTTELRVRPVIRHAITRYVTERHTNGRQSGMSQLMCEVGSEDFAEEIKEALELKDAPRKYVLVERTFKPEARVYYAEWPDQARQHKEVLEKFYPDSEFQIFACLIEDPIELARRKVDSASWAPLAIVGGELTVEAYRQKVRPEEDQQSR